MINSDIYIDLPDRIVSWINTFVKKFLYLFLVR